MRFLSLGLLLTILSSVTHAETYSVCENCSFVKATADYFSATYPGDYEGYAVMAYNTPEVTETKNSQIIQLKLQKYECLDSRMCKPELTNDAELKVYGGFDPIKLENTDGPSPKVQVKIKVGGVNREQECYLGQTLDPAGKYGYSYKNGVNIYCVIGLENQTAMNFNLYFKR